MTFNPRSHGIAPRWVTGFPRSPYIVLAAQIACASAFPTVHSGEPSPNGWRTLASLPDPVGFGGMFAGVLDGTLVTGGGSQWSKPIWLEGKKTYNDRIFTLTPSSDVWAEHTSRLPVKSGHFASATTLDAIYLAGGFDATGGLRSVVELRKKDDDIVWNHLADLPEPIGYASAAIVGGRYYVVGGLPEPSAKVVSTKVWSLDLDTTAGVDGWRREADLPGPGVFVSAAASDGVGLYVFGGIGIDGAGKFSPSQRAYRLSPSDGKWERLADLPEPRVGVARPCPVLPGGRIFLVGGYAEVFPGEMRDHPGFSRQTLYYEVANDSWSNGPVLPVAAVPDRDAAGDPGPAPMIGAPCVVWNDQVVVISGEVRASVRSPAVLSHTLLDLGFLP